MSDHEKDLRRLLDRYIAGQATAQEIELLDKFFESNKVEALMEDISPEQFYLIERRMKSRIDERITSSRSWSPYFRIAASFLLLSIVGYLVFLQRKDTPVATPVPVTLTKATERGQKITIRLPDGTVAKLNSSSEIRFPEKFSGGIREISLRGEAYFDVVHNPSVPFVVKTTHSEIQVLGTSFNINERSAKGTEVTLVTGKVEVSAQGSSVQLKPNQQAIISSENSSIDTATVEVAKYIEWKDNVLRFDKTPLREVVASLEEWYGAQVVIRNKEIEGCKITARYDSESLENVLKSFEFMLKGKYTLQNGKATISGKGCNGRD